MDTKKAIDLLEDIQWGEGTVFQVNRDLAEAAELAIGALEKNKSRRCKSGRDINRGAAGGNRLYADSV